MKDLNLEIKLPELSHYVIESVEEYLRLGKDLDNDNDIDEDDYVIYLNNKMVEMESHHLH